MQIYTNTIIISLQIPPPLPKEELGGGVQHASETLTLFPTKISNFPYPISDLNWWSQETNVIITKKLHLLKVIPNSRPQFQRMYTTLPNFRPKQLKSVHSLWHHTCLYIAYIREYLAPQVRSPLKSSKPLILVVNSSHVFKVVYVN